MNLWDKALKPWIVAIPNLRQKLLVVGVCLALVGGLVLVVLSKKSDQPLHLKIVRTGIEQGKPVVFFRLESSRGKRIAITGAQKIVGDSNKAPLASVHFYAFYSPLVPSSFAISSNKAVAALRISNHFWAPSQQWPMGDPAWAAQDIGVLAPTNVPCWKFRVIVETETISQLGRLQDIPRTFGHLRANGTPLLTAIRKAWNLVWDGFYEGKSQILESDPITNDLPLTSESTK